MINTEVYILTRSFCLFLFHYPNTKLQKLSPAPISFPPDFAVRSHTCRSQHREATNVTFGVRAALQDFRKHQIECSIFSMKMLAAAAGRGGGGILVAHCLSSGPGSADLHIHRGLSASIRADGPYHFSLWERGIGTIPCLIYCIENSSITGKSARGWYFS